MTIFYLADSHVLWGPQQISEVEFLGKRKKRVLKQNFLLQKENEAKSEVFDVDTYNLRNSKFLTLKVPKKYFDKNSVCDILKS